MVPRNNNDVWYYLHIMITVGRVQLVFVLQKKARGRCFVVSPTHLLIVVSSVEFCVTRMLIFFYVRLFLFQDEGVYCYHKLCFDVRQHQYNNTLASCAKDDIIVSFTLSKRKKNHRRRESIIIIINHHLPYALRVKEAGKGAYT